MFKFLAVGVGGFFGAIARYGISEWVHNRLYTGTFPLGTLVVNVLGCFFIGALMTLIESRQMWSPEVRLVLIMGFLGSLTTFSTFGYETLGLLEDDQAALMLLNVLANVLVGLAAVVLGRSAVSLWGA